jgi:hypothetical protein
MRVIRISAIALAALAALPSAAAARSVGLPPESLPRTVRCEDAAAGVGVSPPGAARVGPFRMLGRGDLGSHWNPATRRFTSKVPVVILGARPVTVKVPERLGGRLVMVYGGAGRRFSEEVTFVPCAERRATFFPGAMLFTRREPISLSVRPEGWARPKALDLGVFPPYR